jgi:hypothetical protein
MRKSGAYLVLGTIALLMVSDFVMHGIVPAFEASRTDFSEVYIGAWLWRHGGNFYNSTLATATQERLIGVSVQSATLYPPTAFVLFSPISFLSWGWANFVWLLIALAGVVATIFLLLRLRGSGTWDLKAAALIVFMLSFNPLHQAFHLGNVALAAVPLVLWAVLLAERERDWQAGLAIGMAVCLKPQMGVWVLFYYFLRGRMKVFLAALATGACVAAILFLHPVPLSDAITGYQANVQYWFAPGQPAGFTPGAFPYHVNMIQVILYQLVHSVFASNLVAHAIFVSGLAVWMSILWRSRFRIPAPLAIASLLDLSFISIYHSVSDATILTLALAWVIPSEHQPWTRIKIATCAIFLLMMLPGHSALMRLSPHIAASITSAWWWNYFVTRYFVWLLVALNVVLLFALRDSARRLRETGDTVSAH